MAKNFVLSFIIGLALFVAGESTFYFLWKMPVLMVVACFFFGLLSNTSEESFETFLGLATSHLLGSFIIAYLNGFVAPEVLLSETLRYTLLERNEIAIWIIAFPVGFLMRQPLGRVLGDESSVSTERRREKFVRHQMGEDVYSKPANFMLRDQPSELHTSPSIHIS